MQSTFELSLCVFTIDSSDFIHETDEVIVEAVQASSAISQIQDEFQPETDEV